MIIYGLMKYIEKIPVRYDAIMNFLTLGYHSRSRKILLKQIKPGKKVLDIGCGTGEFAIQAASLGADVVCLDTSPEMLRVFKEKLMDPGCIDNEAVAKIKIIECGSASIDSVLKGKTFDLIYASLMLGELSEIVRKKTIQAAAILLKDDGFMIICDEFWPETPLKSLVYHFLFWIFFIPNFILTRTLIQPVKNFSEHIESANLTVYRKIDLLMGAMTIYWLKRKKEAFL